MFLLQDHHARGRLEGAEAERHERDESTTEVCQQCAHTIHINTVRTQNASGTIITVTFTQENRSNTFRLVECRRDTCIVGVQPVIFRRLLVAVIVSDDVIIQFLEHDTRVLARQLILLKIIAMLCNRVSKSLLG